MFSTLWSPWCRQRMAEAMVAGVALAAALHGHTVAAAETFTGPIEIVAVTVVATRAPCDWGVCQLFWGFYTGARLPDDSTRCATGSAVLLGKVNCLIGGGDLDVLITEKSRKAIEGHRRKTDKPLRLFLNGVNMADSAPLLAQRDAGSAGHSLLRFHLKPGPKSQPLWAMLYRDGGMTQPAALHVALGFDGADPLSQPDADATLVSNHIAVSSEPALTAALVVVALLFGLFLVAAMRTDMLRDGPPPAWWAEAARLRALIPLAESARTAFMQQQFGADHDRAKEAEYVALAQHAAQTLNPVALADERKVVMGLVLDRTTFAVPRPSYSFGRLQMAVWFMFAVLTGLFLWIVYGQLPAVAGSVLVLLTLAAGTAGMGQAAEAAGKPFYGTQGFVTDLLTDSGNRYQIHRFQAVVVNLVLLMIGFERVVADLAFPVFEPSWLTFLGISGATYAAGKQLAENKPVTLVPTPGGQTAVKLPALPAGPHI